MQVGGAPMPMMYAFSLTDSLSCFRQSHCLFLWQGGKRARSERVLFAHNNAFSSVKVRLFSQFHIKLFQIAIKLTYYA